MRLDYNELMGNYEAGLHEQLRNFTTGHDFLETWVPDENHNRSIIGIFEAAAISGMKEDLELALGADVASAVDLNLVKSETSPFGSLVALSESKGLHLKFSFAEKVQSTLSPSFRASLPKQAETTAKSMAPLARRLEFNEKHKVHAAYQANLQLCKERNHEGIAEETAPLKLYKASERQITLSVLVDKKGRIQEARHSGAKGLEFPLFEILCKTIENLPMQEAAEHGVLRVEHRLRDVTVPAPVSGIITPDNADPIFHLPNRLLRTLYRDHMAQTGAAPVRNFWTDPITKAWLTQSDEERKRAVMKVITDLAASMELSNQGFEVSEIKNDVRLVLTTPLLPTVKLGPFLLKLEEQLQKSLGVPLEVLLAERQDKNKPREKMVKELEASSGPNAAETTKKLML